MNLLAELQYFSPISVFKYSIHATHIFFNIYEALPKMSFRNRCIIAGAGGVLHLSIPLQGGRDLKVALKDTRIANEGKWQLEHWRSITSAYNRSPYFEFYRDELLNFYEKKFSFLVDWNLALFEWVCRILDIRAEIHVLANTDHGSEQKMDCDIRNLWLPRNFFRDLQISSVKYRQVFEERIGFQPNLSILDLIFCEGANARNVLENSKNDLI
jgi:hypothetical protein